MMTPTSRMIGAAAAWTGMGAVAVGFPAARVWWLVLGGALGLVAAVDWLACRWQAELIVERRLPGRFALGVPGEVKISLRNEGRRPAKVEMFDGIPPGAVAEDLPWRGLVPPRREIRILYPVAIRERGEAEFSALHLRRNSPAGMWQRRRKHLGKEPVRVYPNYEPVIRFALLAMQQRASPLGIVRRPRGGTSREFHQLREYREGDAMSTIDWKASSRRQLWISRDFQEQRNQSLVFLLDTGRRMRAMDGDLPQFDHVLNALLLVSHVALRQGDLVSVQSFGGTDRSLPPVKGAHAMPTLLNHLYDYQTTVAPSDFAGAVEKLMIRHPRRSLVIVLTNLRGEDGKELIPAMQVLQARHLVLLASLREQSVEASVTGTVEDFSSALKFLAADRYLNEREEVLAGLRASGVMTLDATAGELAISLSNRYLALKSSGRM